MNKRQVIIISKKKNKSKIMRRKNKLIKMKIGKCEWRTWYQTGCIYRKSKHGTENYYEDGLIIPLVIFNSSRMHAHHFQMDVINFISVNFPTFDNLLHKFIINKKYPVKSDKCKIATYVPLKNIISSYQHCLPTQHMDNK